ncbi:MAG: tRNA 5-methoxyuridine(34)/uridine 5-oxyacetic acid(34) synthase CmoB [Pseudomonadota bacterium]
MSAASLYTLLAEIGLEHWREPVSALVESRLCATGHGDMPDWLTAIEQLPDIAIEEIQFDQEAVRVIGDPVDGDALVRSLMALKPWRKGPFDIGGVAVDTEWRSDWKWARVAPFLSSLQDRTVLDVGCGNGYYAFRMIGAGARCVLGVDPTLLFHAQFAAINRYAACDAIHLLPARLEELPAGSRNFDTVFSMGVLYHQRSPIDHLRELKQHLRRAGELVLETLVLPGDSAFASTPPDRYARMRNVWLLPTVSELETWLARSGYREIHVVDVTRTTVYEQRATEWMDFESLEQALDPDNLDLTIEGWPAPTRAVIIARAP